MKKGTIYRWVRRARLFCAAPSSFLAISILSSMQITIIRGGENISAKEVEDTLARVPWIVECAAVAMPDPRLGEQVCAFAIVSDPGAATLEAIRTHFAASGLAK